MLHNIFSLNEATIILIIVVNIMGTIIVIVGVNCSGGNNYGCEIPVYIVNTSILYVCSFFHFRPPQV